MRQVSDTLRELLDLVERYAAEQLSGEERAWVLNQIRPYRQAADFPLEHEVLHAMDKFLVHFRSYATGNATLRAAIEPYIEMTRSAHDRIGGPPLLLRIHEQTRGGE